MQGASKQSVVKGDDYPLKVKGERSAGRVHLIAFWDDQGILLEEYTPKVSQTMKETCFDTLLHLWEAIKKKPASKLLRGVILLHDSAT